MSVEEFDQAEASRLAVAQAADEGALDDDFILEAIEDGNKETVLLGLEKLSSLPFSLIERMIASKNAKVITSLVWKAGLSMRAAYSIQQTHR